ncbi:MAG: FtsX-like permease family protein, partial [Acidobacteriota bacterium]
MVAEVALTLFALTQAGLLLRSFLTVDGVEGGIDARHVVAVELRDPGAADLDAFLATFGDIRRSVIEHPAVASADYGLNLPFELTGGRRGGWNNRFEMVADGETRPELLLRQMPVTPTYFETLGIPVLGGEPWPNRQIRPVPQEDDPPAPLPVVLSRNTAEHFFGDWTGAVGALLHHADDPQRQWWVTAVVADVQHWGLDQTPPFALYLPADVMPHRRRALTMAVRFNGPPPDDAGDVLRAAVWRAAPQVPVPAPQPLADWIEGSTAVRRFESWLFGLFAAAGLVLAAAGIYGALLFAVSERRREMGIRLALGATAAAVGRHVIGGGLRLAGFGLGLGLVLSWWGGRLLESRLYQVSALD